MGAKQPHTGNKRTRKLWQSVWATVAGLVALSALGYWLEKRRETDLRDATEGVTTEFLHDLPAGAPRLVLEDVARELGIDMRHGSRREGSGRPAKTGATRSRSRQDVWDVLTEVCMIRQSGALDRGSPTPKRSASPYPKGSGHSNEF